MAKRAPGKHMIEMPNQKADGKYTAFTNMMTRRTFIIPQFQAPYYRKNPNLFKEVPVEQAENLPGVDDRRRLHEASDGES